MVFFYQHTIYIYFKSTVIGINQSFDGMRSAVPFGRQFGRRTGTATAALDERRVPGKFQEYPNHTKIESS